MYEDYFQNFLGYPGNMYQNPCGRLEENYIYDQCVTYPGYNNMGYVPYNLNKNVIRKRKLEDLYPDIYNIIYPMVRKICMENKKDLNREVLDEMSNEIYNNLETNEGINLNITITNDSKAVERSRELNLEKENKNNILKDLIKILILQELIKTNNSNNYNKGYAPNPVLWQERPY